MRVFSEAQKRLFLARQAKLSASANVMVEDETGRLLIVKANYKSYWSLPGGWLDDGESPRQTAVRELQEETGLQVSADELELVRVIDRRSDLVHTHLFVFRYLKPLPADTQLSLQAAELDASRWVSREEVLDSHSEASYNLAVQAWARGDDVRYLEQTI